MKEMGTQPRFRKWRARNRRRWQLRGLRAVVWMFILIVHRLPWAAAYRLADWLGDALFRLFPRHRRIALQNLRQALGDVCPERERQRLARRSVRNLVRTMVELFKKPQMSQDSWEQKVVWVDQHYLRNAIQTGRGCIVFSAHLGNWEWMVTRACQDFPVSFIVRDQGDTVLDGWLWRLRQGNGGQMILRRETATMLRALQQGRLLGMLVDQNTHRGGVFVPFFGRLAATSPGAVVLAQRRKVPLIPAFIHREGDRHVIVCYPPLRLDQTGDHQGDVWRNTARMTRVIEKAVEAHPDEWLWIHQRWKKRPGERDGG